MSDTPYDGWRRSRSRASVPDGFTEHVIAGTGDGGSGKTSWVHVGWAARAALVLLAVGALLFRIGSTLAVIVGS